MTELIMSGTDVPMARTVRPITDCGIPRLSPKMMAIHTMKNASRSAGVQQATRRKRREGAEAASSSEQARDIWSRAHTPSTQPVATRKK